MEVNGATFTITDRTADSTDASLLSAIGASNEYRAAQQPSASGQASDTGEMCIRDSLKHWGVESGAVDKAEINPTDLG